MYNGIKNHPSYFRGVVDGFAASAASVVILACDRVEMEKASRMMIHDAGIGGMYIEGNAKQFRESVKEVEQMADLLDDLSNMIAQIYVDKAGGSVTSWRSLMASDKWYTAEEAVEAGLADGLVGSTDTENKVVREATASVELPTTWDVEGLRNALKGAFA
jgi:ATP-dependent protease ClpP protease subunit